LIYIIELIKLNKPLLTLVSFLILQRMINKFIIVVLLLTGVLSLDNGLGLTPPMGWNSWNHFACNIS